MQLNKMYTAAYYFWNVLSDASKESCREGKITNVEHKTVYKK